ncbi:hypothetical protein AAF712_016815 [Marasmius tenuissimus]|uniref:Uncharacterized protein n=1 Tax=Marasmius tenuissimus TaxID=585030 RepID=A0ABR2Z6M6_9AGAR
MEDVTTHRSPPPDNNNDLAQQNIVFDSSPEVFNARGMRSANRNPNRNLAPCDYSNLPPGFLNTFGHVTRNEDGLMPSYTAAIEHWQKNVSPEILDVVYDSGGWIALHLFDGGTLQRLSDAKNGNEVEKAIRQYVLGFPGVSPGDVEVMVAQPRCQFLAASNKHAPPRIIFVWVKDAHVRGALIQQQTHDVSDICTFHVTAVDFDRPSWYVMNVTPTFKDVPLATLRVNARYAMANIMFHDC